MECLVVPLARTHETEVMQQIVSVEILQGSECIAGSKSLGGIDVAVIA